MLPRPLSHAQIAPSSTTMLAAITALALSLWALPGHACEYAECHSTGAVSKPAGLDIALPFAAGESVQLLSGYGPNAGSSLHCRAQDSICANDYYALDLVLPDKPSYGLGEPVMAIASGTVISAGWGSSGWAAYGRRVYIQHDFSDGHSYISMYAHLASVTVSEGQTVSQGTALGTLGKSCNNADSCSNFSTPHLHFAIHRDSNFGGSGSGGSYGGRAVIPEPFDGYSNLAQGQILTASGGSVTPPPPPPPACNQLIDGETVIEEDGGCASPTGGALADADGHGGHAYHTAQDNPSPDYAEGLVWQLPFAGAGDYDLWAYVPATVADLTSLATYKVAFSGNAQKVQVDQAAAAGSWAFLGTFPFSAGEGQWVRLGDNHDDPATAGKQLGLDALRLVPSSGCECDQLGGAEERACGGDGTQSRSCDGCHWSPWSSCVEGAGQGGGAASDPSTGGAGAGGTTVADGVSDGGAMQGALCTVGRIGSSGSSPLGWLSLIALAGFVRRRRA